MWTNIPSDFVIINFFKNANKGQIVLHVLRGPHATSLMIIMYIPSSNDSETNFIHNIQHFIQWGNPLWKEEIPPQSPNGGLISTPFLSCVVWSTRVCELGRVCKFWVWRGGLVVRLSCGFHLLLFPFELLCRCLGFSVWI